MSRLWHGKISLSKLAAQFYRKALDRNPINPPLGAVSQPPDPAPRSVSQPAGPVLRAAAQPFHNYVRASHGTYLFVDKTTARVQHSSEINEGRLALHYFELASASKYGFFTTAGSLDRFLCGDIVGLGGILPVRRIQLSASLTAFQHVSQNTFLSAERQPSTNVVFDRDEAREWETFSLHRVRWNPLTERYALAAALISLLGEPPSALSHANIILSCDGSDQDALLALCFDSLTMDDFVALLDIIRARAPCWPSNNGLLRQLLELRAALTSDNPYVPECLLQSDDAESMFWVRRVLPDLMAWRRDRHCFLGPNQHVRLDTDLDFLSILEQGVSTKSTGRLFNFLARFATLPTRGICVVARALNEGVYFLEWLAHHKSLGVETFFVYSDNNNEGSDTLLKRLSEAGAIHWLESITDVTRPQNKAYNHALNALPNILVV